MGPVPELYDLLLDSADYPRRWGAPERTIVICSQQRSGTTLLSEAMYFTGGVGCPVEYFHAGFRPCLERRWQTTGFAPYCACVHAHRTDTTGVFSLKYFWRDIVDLARELAPAEFGELRLASTQINAMSHRRIFALISQTMPNPFFVFLTRRDEVLQAISYYVARGTGRWRRFSGRAHPGACPEYSFEKILVYLGFVQNCNRQWLNFFRANDLPFYPMVYEDLAQDYEATLREFFRAVGRPEARIVPPRLHKQADATSEEFFERFMADFRRQVRGIRKEGRDVAAC